MNLSTLKVGYLNKPPFTRNDQKLDEVFFEIFLTITNHLNVSFTMIQPVSGRWGEYLQENNTWNGLVGDLVSQKVDLVVTSLAQTKERREFIDFSIPVYMYRPVFTR